MIELYTWTTPNGRKASIMLEEVGLAYTVRPINLGKNEQFDAAFLKISPKTGSRRLSITRRWRPARGVRKRGDPGLPRREDRATAREPRRRALQGARMAQLADGRNGPMFGQLGFFAVRSTDKAPLAITRFTEEGQRLLTVLDRQLQRSAYLAGEDYTIADIAAYPWMLAATTFLGSVLGPTIEAMPAVKRWLKAIGERDAVKRGMAVPKV